MAELIFYVLAALSVGLGFCVVTARSPMASVLSLLGAFLCLAVIYLLMGFQFLAAAQILVYAGAIMVLFLFVVMLLNLGDETSYAESPKGVLGARRLAVAGGAAAALAFVGIFAASAGEVKASGPGDIAGGLDPLDSLSEVLFSRYLLPFEASSLLLLATMVGVILLAKRDRPGVDAHTRGVSLGEREPGASLGDGARP